MQIKIYGKGYYSNHPEVGVTMGECWLFLNDTFYKTYEGYYAANR